MNHNSVAIYVSPGDTVGAKGRVEVEPSSDYFVIANDVKTVKPRSRARLRASSRLSSSERQRISVAGRLPTNRSTVVFYKKIESFITTVTEVVPWASLGLPDSLLIGTPASPDEDFEVTRKINGQGGTLKGVELQYQQPFNFLPGALRNFGFIGNFTYVDSEVDYGAYGKNRLTGQSKFMYNATLYYETKRFSARVSAAYRDGYLLSFPGGNNNTEEGVNGATNIDASISYELTKNIKLSLEAVNLTDTYSDRYVDATDRVSNYRHFGREFLLGVRATF